jgi:hypothetical protein
MITCDLKPSANHRGPLPPSLKPLSVVSLKPSPSPQPSTHLLSRAGVWGELHPPSRPTISTALPTFLRSCARPEKYFWKTIFELLHNHQSSGEEGREQGPYLKKSLMQKSYLLGTEGLRFLMPSLWNT